MNTQSAGAVPRAIGRTAALLLVLAAIGVRHARPTKATAVPPPAPSRAAVGLLQAARARIYLPVVQGHGTVAAVEPSVPRGFYDAPFLLVLTSRTAGARIRFTSDGSVPTADNGADYVGPLPIGGSTVIRATAFRDSYLQAPVSTWSYLFLDDVLRQTDTTAKERGFPSTWGREPTDWRLAGTLVPARYGMQSAVLATQADTVRDDLVALPSMSLVTSVADMFGPDGLYSNPMTEGLERPASAEYMATGGQPGFQVDCGVRIAGGYSRRPDVTPKHSFSLRFRSRYGPSKLSYPMFPGSDVASFNVLRLRAAQADSFPFFADKAQYLYDEWGRASQRDMGWLSPWGTFVNLYVDGLYWGIYNVTEEPTSTFAADHLGGNKDDWDVIKDGDAVDGVWPPEVEDGDLATYREMLDIVLRSPNPDPTRPSDQALYRRMAELLDLKQYADYILLQIYGANYDWPQKNYRAARNRLLGGGFQFFVWDYEQTTALRDDPARGFCMSRVDPVTKECGYNADTAGVGGLHGWLAHFPDYRLLFADRVALHLVNPDGALAPRAAAARYQALAAPLDRAIVGEAARWGTASPEPLTETEQAKVWKDYRARYGHQDQTPAMWRAERDRLLSAFFPQRSDQVLGQLCRLGLYPQVNAPAFQPPSGSSTRGLLVTLSVSGEGCPGGTSAGRIYYTRDGSDPRAPGGGLAPSALRYVGTLKVGPYSLLRARTRLDTPSGPVWSAEAQEVYGSPRLAVSEVMYHPADDADAEFVELHSLESVPADVSGYSLGGGITATLPAGTMLGAGGYLVVARDAEAFGADYSGLKPAATYSGKLDNAGDTVVLRDGAGQVIESLTYDDEGLWPLAPDGLGFSLVPLEGARLAGDPESWRASAEVGGSPGRADPLPPYGPGRAVLSEVLADPGPNQDAAVEIANPADRPIDIGGWFLSVETDEPRLYRIPDGTVLPGRGFQVFYGQQLAAAGLRLQPAGGTVFLASAAPDHRLTGYYAGLAYGPALEGLSTGRVATAGGARLAVLQRPTFGVDEPADPDEFRTGEGAPNAPAYVGPVALNEVMYHPADDGLEYLELVNRSGAEVRLSADDGRTWRLAGGVTFEFPADVSVEAGGYAIVSPVSADAFRAMVTVPASTAVLGPYLGHLDNAGETVRLLAPWTGAPDGRDDLFIDMDVVEYSDASPWPTLADGFGPSLERRDPAAFGADAANWVALVPGGTPGRANTVPKTIWLPVALSSF